jgi:transposase-like protein
VPLVQGVLCFWEVLEVQNMSKRQYSDEDKATALTALDANGGNVKRTATQLEIPHKTLDDWAKGRNQNPAVADLRTRKRGSLADKFENLAHLIVDAMPAKIGKATLSQCAVSSGIATDKAIRLRGEGLYPDPAAELCSLLKINRSQLPPTLQLEPGDEIPEGFDPIINTVQSPDNPDSFEPEPVKHESDDNPEDKALMDSDDNEDRVN